MIKIGSEQRSKDAKTKWVVERSGLSVILINTGCMLRTFKAEATGKSSRSAYGRRSKNSAPGLPTFHQSVADTHHCVVERTQQRVAEGTTGMESSRFNSQAIPQTAACFQT